MAGKKGKPSSLESAAFAEAARKAKAKRCEACGYSLVSIHPGKGCPLCTPCPRCKAALRECFCIEGE